MSKMSEIAMELDDQAMELGLESYEDAIERGGYTTYFNGTTYVLAKANADEQEVAHEAWLKEKQNRIKTLTEMLMDLRELKETLNPTDFTKWATTIKDAIEFIEKGEM